MTKTALITGGAIRIGQALATTCASLGYRLVIHYNASEQSAQAFSESLKKQQIEHYLLRCDLSNAAEVAQCFDRIPETFKPVDLLINSAAIFPEQDSLSELNNNWSAVMAINSYAPIELMRQFSEQQFDKRVNSVETDTKSHSDKQIINIIDARIRHNQKDRLVYRWSKSLLQQATKDLADTDSEKIAKLAEGIEFENTEQYIEKLTVLKESYFPKSDAVTSEITETDETIEVSEEKSAEKIDESMQHYTSAIRRYNS